MLIGKFFWLLIVTVIIILSYFYYVSQLYSSNLGKDGLRSNADYSSVKNASKIGVTSAPKSERVAIAAVACGDRLFETLNIVKSALMYTTTPLLFVIIADDNLIETFREKLIDWQIVLNRSFEFEVRKLSFPKKEGVVWRKLFKPCASQRLFLPSLLPHLDSLIYVDTDTLFMGPPSDIWAYFSKFNSSQIAALTNEHEESNVSWYPRFARHPFYGKLGLNSGVMLMNLTRMRAFNWESYVTPILKEWKLMLTWGDQDIINIVFHYHPDKMYLLPCRINYRPDHCMYMSSCKNGAEEGAAILHASRSSFHSNKQPAFQAVYQAVDEYQVGADPVATFLPKLLKYFRKAPDSNCGHLHDVFLKLPMDSFRRPISN